MPRIKIRSGIELYYEIHGTGYPLILIAGTGSHCHKWNVFQTPYFSQYYQTIVYDHRGAVPGHQWKDEVVLRCPPGSLAGRRAPSPRTPLPHLPRLRAISFSAFLPNPQESNETRRKTLFHCLSAILWTRICA